MVDLETCSHSPLDVIKGFRRTDDLRNKTDGFFFYHAVYSARGPNSL